MAKARKFRSAHDGGVTIYAPDGSGAAVPLRIEPDVTYETDDKEQIAALQASPEVREIKNK